LNGSYVFKKVIDGKLVPLESTIDGNGNHQLKTPKKTSLNNENSSKLSAYVVVYGLNVATHAEVCGVKKRASGCFAVDLNSSGSGTKVMKNLKAGKLKKLVGSSVHLKLSGNNYKGFYSYDVMLNKGNVDGEVFFAFTIPEDVNSLLVYEAALSAVENMGGQNDKKSYVNDSRKLPRAIAIESSRTLAPGLQLNARLAI